MTDTDEAQPESPIHDEQARRRAERKRKRRVELAGAVIIAIAAVLTALATHQTGDADGIVEQKNTEGIGLTLQANDTYNLSDAARLVERDLMFSWISARANGETAAGVLRAAMPASLHELATQWLDANDQAFAIPAPSVVDDPFSEVFPAFAELDSEILLDVGEEQFLGAQCALFEAQEAAVRGDGVGLATVILAIALVVGGIAALLNGKAAQMIVITIAALSLVYGAGELLLATDSEEVRAKAVALFFVNEDGTEIEVDELGTPVNVGEALNIVNTACPEIAKEFD